MYFRLSESPRDSIKKGDNVEFAIVEPETGQPFATNIKILPKGLFDALFCERGVGVGIGGREYVCVCVVAVTVISFFVFGMKLSSQTHQTAPPPYTHHTAFTQRQPSYHHTHTHTPLQQRPHNLVEHHATHPRTALAPTNITHRTSCMAPNLWQCITPHTRLRASRMALWHQTSSSVHATHRTSGMASNICL